MHKKNHNIMKKLLSLLLTISLIPAITNAQILKTKVAQGEIEGELHNGFALYKAIPYAEPPVGNLRWKPPVDKAPWQGVYKAKDWANRPPQPIDENDPNPMPCSEDCLYLSVETPAKSADDKLPVFVMIHGGGFLNGTYAGTMDSFVKEGIVYVSIEYRLGAFGFMSLPALSNESTRGTSGNYGLMDQIKALQWVHDNISNFGGDPENVTIAGQSAGGISVSVLCASPLCKGLFKNAISESGGSFWPVANKRGGNTAICTAKSAEKIGLEFQKSLKAKSLKALRRLPFKKIADSTQLEEFWPVVDGYVITDDQYKLYEKGDYNDVNILIGSNSDEGWIMSFDIDKGTFEQNIRMHYGSYSDKLLKLYPISKSYTTKCAMADVFRDGSFAWGTWAWANLQSKTGKSNVYLYYFDQKSDNSFIKSPRGANHGDEMVFIYGWNIAPFNDIETKMSNIMKQYWINFIKTGNPNGDGLPHWSKYQKDTETVMIMHNGFHLSKVPNQEQLNFFEEFFKSKRQ